MRKEKIEIGEKFQNRWDCFSCFRPLVEDETWDFLYEKAKQVPLNKLKDKVYVHVVSQYAIHGEENNGIEEKWEEDETFWIRDLSNIEDFEEFYTNDFCEAKYVLLFCEEEQCKFLGLYQLIYDDYEYQRWKRVDSKSILLKKEALEEQIEQTKYTWAKEETDPKKIEALKKYEDLCWQAIKRTEGEACQSIEKELLNQRAFAQKVLQAYSTAIPYFSEEIQQDITMYQSMQNLGRVYQNAPLPVRQNKKLALRAIQALPQNMEYVAPELKEDRDIIATYEKTVEQIIARRMNSERLCSVIGIDEFGNEIINQFIQAEKQRCSQEQMDEYSAVLTQFIKSKQDNTMLDYPMIELDQEIFAEEQNPIVILIGKRENELSKQIKEKYKRSIEVYTEDVKNSYLKMITPDKEKMLDLLRVILYSKNRYHFQSILEKQNICGNQFDVLKITGSIHEILKQIKDMPRCQHSELHYIQIFSSHAVEEDTIQAIKDVINETTKNRYVEEISCREYKNYGIEILILRANLRI